MIMEEITTHFQNTSRVTITKPPCLGKDKKMSHEPNLTVSYLIVWLVKNYINMNFIGSIQNVSIWCLVELKIMIFLL